MFKTFGVSLEPTLWNEFQNIGAPDLLASVHGICRHTNDGLQVC